MSASAPPVSNKEGKKKKKEDKEFQYEKQADDEGTLEEEEKLEQADAKVNCAPFTCASRRAGESPHSFLVAIVLTVLPPNSRSLHRVTERTLKARR